MYYFVVNPASRSGRGLKVWEIIEATLKTQNISYESTLLEGPGQARTLAASLTAFETSPSRAGTGSDTKAIEKTASCDTAPPRKTIIIVGGDGTLNEFIDGIEDFSSLILGCIPTGSGNDFARSLSLPADTKEALEYILHPAGWQELSVGLIRAGSSTRRFAVSSGIGFDAAVCHAIDRSHLKSVLNRLHMGKLVYLMKALRMIITGNTFRLRIKTDDGRTALYRKVLFAAFMNTPYEGGGFMMCPEADPTDDALDLLIVDSLPKWKIPVILPTAFEGKHTGYKGIHIQRCRRAAILCEAPQCIHTDGEHLGYESKISYELLPWKLRVITK